MTARLDRLVALLQDAHRFDAERLCDHILHSVSPAGDDIALLVLRVHPEDQPRPAEAGPSVLPADLRDHP